MKPPTPEQAAADLAAANRGRRAALSFAEPRWLGPTVVAAAVTVGLALDLVPPAYRSALEMGLLIGGVVLIAVFANSRLLRRLGFVVIGRRMSWATLTSSVVIVTAVVLLSRAAHAIAGTDLPLRHTAAALLCSVAVIFVIAPLSRRVARWVFRQDGR